jgi:hypothetical protein
MPSPILRGGLVLTADLSERPAVWKRLAFIPFGWSESRLGHLMPPVHTDRPLMPPSFAVAPDGSLWVLDVVKRRIAHFTAAGSYLGAVGGLFFDRAHPQPRDIAFADGGPVVLQQFHLAASVLQVVDGRPGPPVEVTDGNGDALAATFVYPAPGPPYVFVDGRADLARLGTGPSGIGSVSWGDPARFAPLAGLPVGRGASVGLDAFHDQGFDLVTTAPGRRIVQPIRLRMVAGRPAGARRVPAVFAAHVQGGAGGGLVVWLIGSPARAGDARAFGGGTWLLRYPTDGAPIVFERLPDPTGDDSFQVRHLALDGRGRIYLMLARRRGMAIYRR